MGDSSDRSGEAWPPGEIPELSGSGGAEVILDLGQEPIELTPLGSGGEHRLGQLQATAICGNDITSSCLYVSALCALQAGPYAPLALCLVAGVLFLYRRIYAEVGSALPLNGGAYNVLLNTTSKAKASLAACLTLLSYIATAVISADEAMHYAHNLWPAMDVIWATVLLLGLFALLNLLGISESAAVAVGIFLMHLLTLGVLVLASGVHVAGDLSIFWANWQRPAPGGLSSALYFGFSAGMLGISGFESSANFIEEQKPGVFPRTLRNMWVAVAFFNPVISLLSLGLVPLADFSVHREDLLAHMGTLSAGPWLNTWVSVDATLVLSGAVLTSYVGVTGLVRRMSLDRCLPQILLRENRLRSTNHWIILLFFILCCSILFITRGDVALLGGVYTLSFLGVMSLFAVGNMLLKVSRGRLPRAEKASWPVVVVALVAVCAGLAGNVLLDPSNVQVFLVYLVATVLVVAVMFLRIQILKLVLFISRSVMEKAALANERISGRVRGKIDEINSQAVIFFTRGDNAANLNRAALYVQANEHTNLLKVVHVFQDRAQIPPHLTDDLKHIDRLYPDLRVDFIAVQGAFGPELIERLSRLLDVPKNYMFIGCPGDAFPHNIAELGGVRLIL